jgi:hypothetical protein
MSPLKTVFENYDLELVGDLVDDSSSPIDQAFVSLNRWSGNTIDPELFNENYLLASDATSSQLTVNDSETVVSFDDTAQFAQDDANQWTGSNLYTAIGSGTHSIVVALECELTGPSQTSNYAVVIKKNGVVAFEQEFQPPFNTSTFMTMVLYADLLLTAGDEMQVFLKKIQGKDIEVVDGVIQVKAPQIAIGEIYGLNSQMPDIKLVDWIGGLISSYNWVLYPDLLDDSKWYIQTVPEWYADGDQISWKDKIDLANITYKKPKVYKEINMKYKPSDSVACKNFRDQAGRNFGELNLRPDVEFAESKFEVENPCTLIPPALFQVLNNNLEPTGEYANITIHKSLSQDGSPVEEQSLIFIFRGLGVTTFTYYLQDGIDGFSGLPTSVLQAFYPIISFSEDGPTGNSLAFSLESDYVGAITPNTVWARNWENQIRVQYAKESRQLEKAILYLNPVDVYDYRLNDEIFIEENWWRIIEISHATNNEKARVTLISSRLLTAPNEYEIKSGGKINFDTVPDVFDLSALGAFKKGSSYFGSFILPIIQPSLNTYQKAINNYTQTTVVQIEQLGGRIRTWDTCADESDASGSESAAS